MDANLEYAIRLVLANRAIPHNSLVSALITERGLLRWTAISLADRAFTAVERGEISEALQCAGLPMFGGDR